MADRQTHIQIPERREGEPPASAQQLQRIRQLSAGRSLQGFRFDYRKLGTNQADTIIQQLNAMTDQPPISNKPSKQGPGCIASLAKGTAALIVWAIVLAGVAGGGYLIYWRMNQQPAPSDAPPQADATDNTGDPPTPANKPNSNGSTGSTIFEGLGVSDHANPPSDPRPDTPDTTPDITPPAPDPTPSTPTIDRTLSRQLAGLEELLVKLSQYTRSEFAADVRDQSSQAMHLKLDDYAKALAALDATDPTLSLRIRAAIDAFAAPSLDGPPLREEIKSLRQAIEQLK